ncbi:MAG TPA: Stp1/IreP family PP2C-type Ser/Thr phosphatase [Acidiferrobacteraceae bacterium]|nr:Stp1/IreP family PP2C-type Ser/Thr phosphatase [Acidiferrobacteraceae bacterium]
MKIEITGITDTGQVREHNEDSIATEPSIGLAVLADGMGGHQAGEVASQIAVEAVTEKINRYIDAREADSKEDENSDSHIEKLVQAVEDANTQILRIAEERPECRGMGATIVAAFFKDDRFSVAHLGDSRMYRLRGDSLKQITDDHSLVQELVRQGMLTPEEAQGSLNKNLITRALGIEDHVTPDINQGKIEEGDLYLLCSDGLTDVVNDEQIRQTLHNANGELEESASTLVNMANEAGGPDNISVILVRTLE